MPSPALLSFFCRQAGVALFIPDCTTSGRHRPLHACCMSRMHCHTFFAPNLPCSASWALQRKQAFLAFLTALRASLLALANSSLTHGDPLLSHFAYRLFLCWKRGSRVSALSLHQSGYLSCSLPKTSVAASISPLLFYCTFYFPGSMPSILHLLLFIQMQLAHSGQLPRPHLSVWAVQLGVLVSRLSALCSLLVCTPHCQTILSLGVQLPTSCTSSAP